MSPPAVVNHTLEKYAPSLFAALSPLGWRAFYPPDIPTQAQDAKHTTYNSTIGVFTDGHGHAVPLPTMSEALNLDDADMDAALLYSPVAGRPEMRQLWRQHQRAGIDPAVPSSLPFVTVGLAHGLSLIADLFGGEGKPVAVATPFWGNYRQAFSLRTGAVMRTAPCYRDGRFNIRALGEALHDLAPGEPAVGIVNFPSNPGGYSPTVEERADLKAALLEIATDRPFVLVCDDAYAGLAYEEGIPNRSIFWELVGQHENLIPVKVDGATKEFFFFGGRVGFLTFGYKPDSPVMEALENKLQCLARSTIGSPVASSQVLLLQALRNGEIGRELEALREIGRRRYRMVKPLLAKLDPSLLRPLPMNAGFFVLLELPAELDLRAHDIRQHLIEHHDTGIVALGERYLRLALCSVDEEAIPELLRRVEAGVRELVR